MGSLEDGLALDRDAGDPQAGKKEGFPPTQVVGQLRRYQPRPSNLTLRSLTVPCGESESIVMRRREQTKAGLPIPHFAGRTRLGAEVALRATWGLGAHNLVGLLPRCVVCASSQPSRCSSRAWPTEACCETTSLGSECLLNAEAFGCRWCAAP